MSLSRQSQGFTLVELMVALVLNVVLLSALTDIFVANLLHYNKVIQMNQLNEQLQSAVYYMTSEIRRAGYSATASNDIGNQQNTNAFMVSGSTDVTVNASNNCILFTYDRAGTGTLPAISASTDDERYGFRLTNNTIQTRPPGATFSCTATSSNWESMTDANIIDITNLSFTLNTTTVATSLGSMLVRSVDISVTGQLVMDATVTKTITAHVRIRNDKYVP